MINSNIKTSIVSSIFFLTIVFSACTKVEPRLYSGLTTDVFYSDSNAVLNAQDQVTVTLKSFGNSEEIRLSNTSSGELVDPLDLQTDGTPNYLEKAYKHSFDPTIIRFKQVWDKMYTPIRNANVVLSEILELKNKPAAVKRSIAEIKVARAFFFYHAMDDFGNIPLDTMFNADPATVKTVPRAEVFKFIEKELRENIPLLKSVSLPNTRINKYVGFTLLAQLYLNAQVYTGTPRWKDAMDACDSVMKGPYQLTTNYFSNFTVPASNQENILVGTKSLVPGDNSTFIPETINDIGGPAVGITGAGWNAFVGPAEMYNIYQSSDYRRRMWAVGVQRVAMPGERQIDGVPNTGPVIKSGRSILNYNTNVRRFGSLIIGDRTNPLDSQLFAGARNVKYYPRQGADVYSLENNYVIMRLADIYLMKVEADLRLNGTLTTTQSLFDKVRTRAYGGNSAFNILNPTLAQIRDERTREFMWEGYGRRDNIRFEIAEPSGIKYWSKARLPLKPDADADLHTIIFPIPKAQLDLNPRLVQNPGY